MLDPKKIAVAGDWHGNTQWACTQVERISEALGDEPNKLILHLGDFGFYPGKWGDSYRYLLTYYLSQHDITLWAIDGNHENHPWLRKQAQLLKEEDLDIPGLLPNACLYPITTHIAWLSRGYRWQWHGREWLALGGAASVDKSWRLEQAYGKAGMNWWPEEEISQEDTDRALEGGRANVMVTHDAPDFVHYQLPNVWNPDDVDTAEKHRQRLGRIVDTIKPSYLMHGHLHLSKQSTVTRHWGQLEVTALDCDGSRWNWLILDTEKMEWLLDV
jgi:hypothetical protein